MYDHVFEARHQLLGGVRELEDVDEVVVGQRVQDGVDGGAGELAALAGHGARTVHQDDDVLGRGSRAYVPSARPEVVHVPVVVWLLPHRRHLFRWPGDSWKENKISGLNNNAGLF